MESGSPAEDEEEQAVRKLKKPRRETEKGALFEDYSLVVH
jgi:hypothetical protein